ncbi:hypothetical protein [Thermomonas sp.]|uniref:hypothetical protein n=1 Tax=Thermomonas sp. TaxID=1971895 RepID=UPI002625DB17|nr:hypothetical protein [Thermomonas sp.]MCC7312207.1 hypothetical protein [Sulfuritalea sp.]
MNFDLGRQHQGKQRVGVGMVVVAAARLLGIAVADPTVILVMHVLVMPEMLTMLGMAINAVAYPGRRRVGGIDRDDECQQEDPKQAHATYYIRETPSDMTQAHSPG